MSNEMMKCPKCSGEMAQGFIADAVQHAAQRVSSWVEGAPEKSFWSGTKVPSGMIPIGTFRCSTCGFLESYARDEFKSK